MPTGFESNDSFQVYLGVKTCEVFCSFLTIIFLVLTSQWLLCTHCFMSLMSSTGFYTEDEPSFLMISRLAGLSLRFSVLKIKKKFI